MHCHITALLCLQIRRCNISPLIRHMDISGYSQRHISVNTGTGIPAAGREFIHCFHGNHIFRLSVTGHIICNIQREVIISIEIFTNLIPVYIYICMIIDTVKIQRQSLSFIISREYHCLPVPACPAWQETGFRLVLRRKFLIHAEVVRDLNIFPLGIVKLFLLCPRCISKAEFPSGIKIPFVCLRIRDKTPFPRLCRSGLFCFFCRCRHPGTAQYCNRCHARCQPPGFRPFSHKLLSSFYKNLDYYYPPNDIVWFDYGIIYTVFQYYILFLCYLHNTP